MKATEKQKADFKKYYILNKDKIKEYKRKNRKYFNEYSAMYKKKNPELTKLINIKYRIKNKDKIKQSAKNYYFKNFKKVQIAKIKYALRTKYNITIEIYDQMFKKQKGRCAICNRHQDIMNKPLNVDHNHKTGKVRELLCVRCNMVLGSYENSDTNKFEAYLKKHKEKLN
jgi:hypothetical protein